MKFKFAMIVGACAVVVGCGGTDPAPIVATQNLTSAVTATNVAALAGGTSFSFPAGVPALGTSGATSMTINAPASATASPTFSVTEGATSFSGTMGFGSCILTVTQSSNVTRYPIGSTITINPCSVNAQTGGLNTGTATNASVTLTFGTTTSTGVLKAVTVNTNGTVSIGGIVTGTVTTGSLTG